MSLDWRWEGKDDLEPILLIAPASESKLASTNAFVHTVHERFPSASIFVFDHAAEQLSDVLRSRETLLDQIAEVLKRNTRLQDRRWLFLAFGVGGLVVKAALSAEPPDRKAKRAIVLIDVPNLTRVSSSTALSKNLNLAHTSCTENVEAFKKLCEHEATFNKIAHLYITISCTVPDSKFSWPQVSLDTPNELQYHFRGDSCTSSSSAIVSNQEELRLMIDRAFLLLKGGQQLTIPDRLRSKLGQESEKALEAQLPLHEPQKIASHSIKFTLESRNSDLEVQTQVRSSMLLLSDLPNIQCTSLNSYEPTGLKQEVEFMWHHGSANHGIWIEDIMSSLMKNGSGICSKTHFDAFWSHHVHSTENLYPGSWHIRPDFASISKLRTQPTESTSTEQGLVLVMPFLHWDTVASLTQRQQAIDILTSEDTPEQVTEAYRNAATNPDTRHTSLSITAEPPVHLPLLLDQYRYPTSSMQSSRLASQILPKQTAMSDTGMKTLIVQQLWLVITDNRTIVTFFPRKPLEANNIELSQAADVETTVLDHLSRIDHPSTVMSSVYDLCALIIDRTTTALLSRVRHTDLLFIQLYRKAVGELRQQHMTALASFRNEDLKKATNNFTADTNKENFELSLVLDANTLKDEMQGLVEIIQTQKNVVEKVSTALMKDKEGEFHLSIGTEILEETKMKLSSFETQFQGLRSDADAIEQDLLQLLDLRQKRANLRESHAAWVQAEETSAQTRHSLSLSVAAARQGRVVMIFTILSSIYLPLSFMTSYYGMNMRDITGDADNPKTTAYFWKISGPLAGFTTLLALIIGFQKKFIVTPIR
ncbi:hypothetical protein EJ05DRAFT_513296 [Pseudovirgaria hyperparasitica]|uniref:Uncharacterized protein n=1 Tax=Pseudovirgaria hyperparasitica TaxID=470096 RepID=A0A6A6VXQ9_9PEZI|nr:uncharacterized protein EJ05DRAFT_513296 [Pseudovirgaria hyperparasitica]KAF2754965.1 hypothetical protein EJ05DRAFT_513296 [Pseudovirgaria hyperparasitica]